MQSPPFPRYLVPTVKGHLTILAVFAPTEGRDELNEEFYETLQKIFDKVNKSDFIMLIGNMNAKSRK